MPLINASLYAIDLYTLWMHDAYCICYYCSQLAIMLSINEASYK